MRIEANLCGRFSVFKTECHTARYLSPFSTQST